MKKILLMAAFFCVASIAVKAQMPKPVRAEIKTPTAVCEECKTLIEAAVGKIDGIIKVNVIYKRGVTLVQWYPDRTDIEELKTEIANTGFDADDVTANVDVYKKLPICCKKVSDGGGPQKKKKPGTK